MQSPWASGAVRREGVIAMQSLSDSVSSPSISPAAEILSWLLRHFRSAAVAERPAIRWAEMKPIDFQGEDTSLTQEQLDALR
jgi:hypothetical protein